MSTKTWDELHPIPDPSKYAGAGGYWKAMYERREAEANHLSEQLLAVRQKLSIAEWKLREAKIK